MPTWGFATDELSKLKVFIFKNENQKK